MGWGREGHTQTLYAPFGEGRPSSRENQRGAGPYIRPPRARRTAPRSSGDAWCAMRLERSGLLLLALARGRGRSAHAFGRRPRPVLLHLLANLRELCLLVGS